MESIDEMQADDLRKALKEAVLKYEQSKEADAQKIHQLKRQLETAVNAERFLSEELQLLESQTISQGSNSKLEAKLGELQAKYNAVCEEKLLLQDELEKAKEEKQQYSEKLLQAEAQAAKPQPDSAGNASQANFLEKLEAENLNLAKKLAELQQNESRIRIVLAEKERMHEMYEDKILCLEENMRYKIDELNEKSQLLESAQEQLCESNMKIASFQTAAENDQRKGNSLFAEVDDQRQAMKMRLNSQRTEYIRMKVNYEYLEQKMRHLKRENTAMFSELRTVSEMFVSDERAHSQKLCERIGALCTENERLRRELKKTQDFVTNFSKDNNGVKWVNSMLTYCKKETEDMRRLVYATRLQKTVLEEQHRNLMQEMIRWRFECLQNRCLLRQRENLLEEHKISFEEKHYLSFPISQDELESAKPSISIEKLISTAGVSSPVSNKNDADINNKENDKEHNVAEKNAKEDEQQNAENNKQGLTSQKCLELMIEKLTIDENKPLIPRGTSAASLLNQRPPSQRMPLTDHFLNKEWLDSFRMLPKVQPKVQPQPQPLALPQQTDKQNNNEKPSILRKHANIFDEGNSKTVTFSSEPAIIHHIVQSDDETVGYANKNLLPVNGKEKHPKANIIIRNIVMRPKKK